MRNPFKKRAISKTRARVPEAHRSMDTATAVGEADSLSEAGETIDGRLVVLGRESTFSEEVVDYAIDMARRMSFEIVALNSAPFSCDAFNLFSGARSRLCQEFKAVSEKNALAFSQAASAAGVPFVHVVKFDEPEQALTGVQKEYQNVEFVISEAQPQQAAEQVAQPNRPRNEVLVYSMI